MYHESISFIYTYKVSIPEVFTPIAMKRYVAFIHENLPEIIFPGDFPGDYLSGSFYLINNR